MEEGIRTYREMAVAIIFQIIVYAVAGAFISGQYVIFPVSVAIGGAVAMGALINMRRCIDIALDLDSVSARRYATRQSLIRIATMGLSLCVAFFFRDYINPWGVLVGIFSLKISAYLQPGVHRCFDLLKKRRIRGK